MGLPPEKPQSNPEKQKRDDPEQQTKQVRHPPVTSTGQQQATTSGEFVPPHERGRNLQVDAPSGSSHQPSLAPQHTPGASGTPIQSSAPSTQSHAQRNIPPSTSSSTTQRATTSNPQNINPATLTGEPGKGDGSQKSKKPAPLASCSDDVKTGLKKGPGPDGDNDDDGSDGGHEGKIRRWDPKKGTNGRFVWESRDVSPYEGL